MELHHFKGWDKLSRSHYTIIAKQEAPPIGLGGQLNNHTWEWVFGPEERIEFMRLRDAGELATVQERLGPFAFRLLAFKTDPAPPEPKCDLRFNTVRKGKPA